MHGNKLENIHDAKSNVNEHFIGVISKACYKFNTCGQ